MIDSHEFSFEDSTHIYRNGNGIVVPSVTQTLKNAGVISYEGVPAHILENARRRGTNIHMLTAELDIYGEIDPTWLKDDEVPYFEAWKKFRKESGFVINQIEQRMLTVVAGMEIAGTPDRIGTLHGQLCVVDIKCCRARHEGWALQLADYELMYTGKPRVGHMVRMVVQLFPTGKYSAFTFDDPTDAAGSIAALTISSTTDRVVADHARAVLSAWAYNHRLKLADLTGESNGYRNTA